MHPRLGGDPLTALAVAHVNAAFTASPASTDPSTCRTARVERGGMVLAHPVPIRPHPRLRLDDGEAHGEAHGEATAGMR